MTERFEQEISGTLVKFWMAGIPGDGPEAAFYIAETPTTWDLYDIWTYRLDLSPQDAESGVDAELRPSKPYGAPDWGFGHFDYPAIGMTHVAAQQFCVWLSEKTGRKYRLPTPDEWEIAARAGRNAVPEALEEYAWFNENANEKTHPVRTKRANLYGLYDCLGNVLEWCVSEDGCAVLCGGSFASERGEVGFANRQVQDPSWNERDPQLPKSNWWLCDAPFVGFRLACDP
jgi:formylglycine-generating enzyme required for sulfatase activity